MFFSFSAGNPFLFFFCGILFLGHLYYSMCYFLPGCPRFFAAAGIAMEDLLLCRDGDATSYSGGVLGLAMRGGGRREEGVSAPGEPCVARFLSWTFVAWGKKRILAALARTSLSSTCSRAPFSPKETCFNHQTKPPIRGKLIRRAFGGFKIRC